MAAGEFLVLANTYVDTAAEYIKSGAPIAWLPGRDPVPASTYLLGIRAFAHNPNAAKLFVDFLLSRDGQKALSGGAVAKRPQTASHASHRSNHNFQIRPADQVL
jgi:iron(III) transport system substrate-binding protein